MSRPLTRPQAAAAATPLRPRDGRGRAVLQQDGDHDRRERDDRADREVDAAGDDDRGHADRRHADDRRLARHQLQVAGLDELDAGEQREHERDEHQPDEGAGAVEQRSCGHARAAPPVIVATIRSDSVSSATGRARLQPPAEHDRDAVADAEQLGQIAADEEHGLGRRAGGRADELVDQRVDLRLARDVDAPGRLVEHEHVHAVIQQSREGDLLLVAARELRHGLSGTGAADGQIARSTPTPRGAGARAQTVPAAPNGARLVIVRLSAMLRPGASPRASDPRSACPCPAASDRAACDPPL